MHHVYGRARSLVHSPPFLEMALSLRDVVQVFSGVEADHE